MASNLSIESPNFEKINKEAGQHTEDAINLLWQSLNLTRQELRRNFRLTSNTLAPKIKQIDAAASVDNVDLEGASIVSFVGTTAQNFTGMRAPETGASRVVFVQVNGTGTITAKHEVTSESANRLTNADGLDATLSTGKGIVYVYLSSRWREVARSV